MKRTNVIVDEDLLKEAMRITGKTTYSAVIAHALEQIIKDDKIQAIFDMQGTGWWEGDYEAMRGHPLIESPEAFERLLARKESKIADGPPDFEMIERQKKKVQAEEAAAAAAPRKRRRGAR